MRDWWIDRRSYHNMVVGFPKVQTNEMVGVGLRQRKKEMGASLTLDFLTL